MATGEARRLQQKDPRPVAFRGKDGRARWDAIFEGNPRISRDGVGAQWCENRSGNRPYIQSLDRRRFVWVKKYEPPRGEIYFSTAEKAFGDQGRRLLIIEPNIKHRDGSNKDWGFYRWQSVVAAMPHLPWAQVGPSGTRFLAGVQPIVTATFRQAAAVLGASFGYVGHEGGLHHAAAALNKPAVVIFGGFISPDQTGYPEHSNLYAGGKPCGNRLPCAHCKQSMEAISIDMVIEAIRRTFR